MKLDDLGDLTFGQLKELSQMSRPKETYKDRDDFLINLGLDLVSRKPSGNIISTSNKSKNTSGKRI